MTKNNFYLIFCALAFIPFIGCDSLISEDEKIKEALMGRCYEEDIVDEDGNTIKDITGEYYKDGRFRSEATWEIIDDESFEVTDITFKLYGTWSVKDKFIYYTYDFDKLEISPDYFGFMRDEFEKILKERNSPEKVIEYDASKIIYEDSDGKRYHRKKSY